MGAAAPQPSQPLSGVPAGAKPFLFLASCPEECLQNAVDVVVRCGGFHCAVGAGGSLPSSRAAGANSAHLLTMMGKSGTAGIAAAFGAWRGRVEAQFLTLRQLSPPGRKVIAVAIAGFGHCNDERAYLQELCGRRGFEQLAVKQCGDLDDLSRWLKDEGFAGADALPCALGLDAGPVQSGLCVSRSPRGTVPLPSPSLSKAVAGNGDGKGLWASLFQSAVDPQVAHRERLLSDLTALVVELRGLSETSPAAELYEAARRLMEVASTAKAAGATDEEVFEGECRVIELEELAAAKEEAERRAGWLWPSLCCFCCSSAPQVHEDSAHFQADLGGLPYVSGAHVADAASMQLPLGVKCLYLSPSWSGWVPARVSGCDVRGGTYHLNIRKHVKLENIRPASDALAAEAWPPGTWVTYQSETFGQGVPAVITGFKEGRGGAEGVYDLDVKINAPCDRIRPRLHPT